MIHLVRSLNVKGATTPHFFDGVSDEEVNSIILKYMRYRFTRERQQAGGGAGNQVWSRSLNPNPPNPSQTFADFKALIENDMETWFNLHPDVDAGGVSGGASSASGSASSASGGASSASGSASYSGGGASSASGGSSTLSGEYGYVPLSDDDIEERFSQMKERFGGLPPKASDDENRTVLNDYLGRLRDSNRPFPEYVWSKGLGPRKGLGGARNLHSFAAHLNHNQDKYETGAGGLGMYGKGLFRAPESPRVRGLGGQGLGKGYFGLTLDARPGESSASASGAEEEEEDEDEMDEGYFAGPYSPAHYPPPSPSSSATSHFQPFGAPAEALASLRL
jgi:hypothetical protein